MILLRLSILAIFICVHCLSVSAWANHAESGTLATDNRPLTTISAWANHAPSGTETTAAPTETRLRPPTSGEEGVFLTRTEFDEFLRLHRNEHQSESKATAGAATGAGTAWKKGKFTITPYGYINLSASYETQETAVGDFCVYANSPDIDNGAGFHFDPRASRLGIRIDGPGIDCWRKSKTEGVAEVDFQGNYTLRNRSSLLLRKAYVSVSDDTTRFLAGQDWEVISPLYPKTLNYTAGAGAGNVGYRRAMVRLDHRFDLTSSSNLTAQCALTDNILRDGFNMSNVAPHAGSWPVLQGRLAYSFGKGCFKHGRPVTVGVSSHMGEQRFEFTGGPLGRERKYFKTWSLNVDLDLPLTERLGFQSEYFVGENLGTIEGGILQGVDLVRRDTIRSQGGWAALQYRWTKKLETNFCYMVDDPYNSDIVSGNAANNLSRTYNQCLFVNALYNWSDALMTGFEVGFWRTNWQRYDPVSGAVSPLQAGRPIRYEFVTRYVF